MTVNMWFIYLTANLEAANDLNNPSSNCSSNCSSEADSDRTSWSANQTTNCCTNSSTSRIFHPFLHALLLRLARRLDRNRRRRNWTPRRLGRSQRPRSNMSKRPNWDALIDYRSCCVGVPRSSAESSRRLNHIANPSVTQNAADCMFDHRRASALM
jgi:hypothetical protein